jgi:hypothetical protein
MLRQERRRIDPLRLGDGDVNVQIHVDRIAFEMKILNPRRVRKNLFDHFARQSLQKRLPSRTPILLLQDSAARPVRFPGGGGRGRGIRGSGRSNIDIDVFGSILYADRSTRNAVIHFGDRFGVTVDHTCIAS